MSNQEQEIFTDEMNEEQIVEAFMKSKSEEPEEVSDTPVEASTEEVVEELEQPTEEPVQEEVVANTEPQEQVTEEESSSDIIDFTNPVILKDREVELPINNSEELLNLAKKGLNFTRKTQDFAKHKPTLDYMQKHDITLDKLQTYAEAQSGNTDALGHIAKESNIDPLDIDTTNQYNPSKDYAPQAPSEVESYANEISSNPMAADKFRGAVKDAPEVFINQLSTDVNVLKNFNSDVQNGIAERVMPEATRLHSIYGGDFVNHYISVAGKLEQSNQAAPVVEQQQSAPKPPSENRAKASISSSTASPSNSMEFDVWGASDAELMNKINQLSNK